LSRHGCFAHGEGYCCSDACVICALLPLSFTHAPEQSTIFQLLPCQTPRSYYSPTFPSCLYPLQLSDRGVLVPPTPPFDLLHPPVTPILCRLEKPPSDLTHPYPSTSSTSNHSFNPPILPRNPPPIPSVYLAPFTNYYMLPTRGLWISFVGASG